MQERAFTALLRILDGEQQIIQRTDQKAFTMLSILGVFMVFFIVHFTKKCKWILYFSFNFNLFSCCHGCIVFFDEGDCT